MEEQNPELIEQELVDASDEGVSVAKDNTKALEEEGEIAADYLEELLDIFDLDGDIEIDVREGRAYVSITAEGDSNLSVISAPETVQALQELTRLAVQVKTNSFSRLILDIGGSRQARVDDLNRIVGKLVAKVKDTEEPVHMKPMFTTWLPRLGWFRSPRAKAKTATSSSSSLSVSRETSQHGWRIRTRS